MTPSPDNFRRAADRLDAYRRKAAATVDMSAAGLHVQQNPCRTVACTAGHYLAARWLEGHSKRIRRMRVIDGMLKTPTRQGYYLTVGAYTHGAHELARDLGFSAREELEDWAHRHPDLWGNEHGSRLFESTDAWNKNRSCNVTIETIARHLRNVAQRLENTVKGIPA